MSLAASLENMSHAASLEKWRPQALSVLRIVVALLFLQSGLEKFFGFPAPGPQLAGVIILAAAIETIGGLLLLLGLFSRWVAFVMSGEMAFAYFMVAGAKVNLSRGQWRKPGSALLLRVSISLLRWSGSLEPGPHVEAGIGGLAVVAVSAWSWDKDHIDVLRDNFLSHRQ
jgi:putative oxidoreductase